MASLWVPDADEGWAVLPLRGDEFDLAALPLQSVAGEAHPRLRVPIPSPERMPHAVLARLGEDGAEDWVLLASDPSPVRVNGLPVPLGIQMVNDRDEIRIGVAGAVFFSTEKLAKVEPFPGAEESIFCPRCKLEINAETPAVRCPECRVWYHEVTAAGPDLTPARNCWTYADTCGLCPMPTALDTGFRWTPEDL